VDEGDRQELIQDRPVRPGGRLHEILLKTEKRREVLQKDGREGEEKRKETDTLRHEWAPKVQGEAQGETLNADTGGQRVVQVRESRNSQGWENQVQVRLCVCRRSGCDEGVQPKDHVRVGQVGYDVLGRL